ncbi:AraC family transcriptional regulator [Dactylosporangium vinaceum]|uniref:Helix-turn-helix transcriptional regulator n=1 Tax=Dactylosporangium vinaceum TaxID=53362 RepID=A0ABV5M5Q8_9ACTN|nr:helix-turn-helix transcriptional regulator [Dactylosporangium vinaceum]
MISNSGHPVVLVGDRAMANGSGFAPHAHPVHQLAWATAGAVSVSTEDGAWVLPATRALWIPAGVPHAVDVTAPAVFRSVYLDRNPHRWTRPTVVAVTPLLDELAGYLTGSLEKGPRRRAEAVLLDLLHPVTAASLRIPLPRDERALAVARALLADPADGRDLDAWGRTVGASGRTLARAFTAETGLSFGRWRVNARLRAALFLLATQTPVSSVAARVGYGTPSAFIAAFKSALGVSPGAYFAP